MAFHNDLGREGEVAARQFLESKGYSIMHTNWRFRNYEVDIVARKGSTIVVAEVKTRSDNSQPVEEIMAVVKEKSLSESADAFMENLKEDLECRIDLLVVQKISGQFNVIHIEDAISQT